MLIRLSPGRDDRDALVFDDVASALDAGLSPAQIGADPAAGDRILAAHVAQRGAILADSEVAVLVASWQSGRGPAALRRLADQRRRRAEFTRTVSQSLRYPLLLVVLASAVALITGSAFGNRSLPIGVAVALASLVALAVAAGRGIRRGDPRWLRLPLLGPVARDLAEIPYLETLHSLYASGVPILQAHPQAIRSCPVASISRELQQVDDLLQQRRPLAEAMAIATHAVHLETRQLIANGELAGNLEETLAKALERRRSVAGRTTAALARTIGNGAYALGLLVAVLAIWSFYRNYYGMLLHH